MSDLPSEVEPRNRGVPHSELLEAAGVSGLLHVEGISYSLPTMNVGELNALHNLLATQADYIRAQLAARDIEQWMAGSMRYDLLVWRNRARHSLALKKKQMGAIHVEFARRKALVKSVEDYAFEAVRQIYGEEGWNLVYLRARQLREEHNQLRIAVAKRIVREL